MRQTVWVALLLAFSASGQQMSLDFEPGKTKIDWSLSGNFHTTHGTFQLQEGHVKFDAAAGTASGDLVVRAATGESGNDSRDKRMKSEVLEADKYPEIRFRVTKLEGAVTPNATSKVRALGEFTIHGVSHQLAMPFEVTLKGNDLNGTGKFTIPFVEWGMRDPSNFLFKVDKTVEVNIAVSGSLKR